jgi:phosphoribosylformimino-5-aminoimidazole carboxamide ribotide isomerase
MARRRSIFRPCIDLHDGQVKQIVGGTLSEKDPSKLKTNFIARQVAQHNPRCGLTRSSSQSPGDFARVYREHGLEGGHVIKLGPRNDDAAREALMAWPSGLQVGGGINDKNAKEWLDAGASKVSFGVLGNDYGIFQYAQVIVTSYLFPNGKFSLGRLRALSSDIGKENLVVDLRYTRMRISPVKLKTSAVADGGTGNGLWP